MGGIHTTVEKGVSLREKGGLYGARDFITPEFISGVLLPLAEGCTSGLRSAHVAFALGGLRWASDSRPLRRLLRVLAHLVRSSDEVLDPRSVGISLVGLGGLSDS
eukprot:Hpha_TRINITY_DN14943_c3_g9::TRINITY_DN14943_c3_g9_i2::g.143131::m.143131